MPDPSKATRNSDMGKGQFMYQHTEIDTQRHAIHINNEECGSTALERSVTIVTEG